MRILLFNWLVFLSVSTFAAETTIENVHVRPAPGNTQVVFDISAPVKHRLFSLKAPPRAVIDFKHASARKDAIKLRVANKYLRDIRSATHNRHDLRVVLDLKENVAFRSFFLQPDGRKGHRFVIELRDSPNPGNRKFKLTETRKNILPFKQPRDVVIAIDAGHGGKDPGARGPGGAYEKDVVLKIARRLADTINRQQGMRAVLIRRGNYYMHLRQRFEKAREKKADLFISIHADAFHKSNVRGSSVYVLSQRGASSEAARRLAERENASDLIGGISLDGKDDMLASVLLDLSQTASLEASINVAGKVLNSLKRVGKVHKQTVQSAGFMVLKSPDIPSILIEAAFISNPYEEKKLLSNAWQRKFADAVVKGLHAYFRDFAPPDTLLASRKHIIERGDTLSKLAQRYQVTTNMLRRYNGLKNDLLRIGQTINIPADSET